MIIYILQRGGEQTITKVIEKPSAKGRKSAAIYFREPTADDGSEIFELVKKSKVLDVNSSYSYLMWGKYFNKTSIVAVADRKIVGFISGFLQPTAPDTLFVWQVVVDRSQRGKGLATTLLLKLIKRLEHTNIRFLEATVTPSNAPSNNLFKGLAKKLETRYTKYECFSEEQFPDPSHEAEIAYRIGPLK
ncbi:diaminobutyrate acetyltransferase [Siminovitchia fortis]|uniref:diaminobutyrate acetyltransferase n=1 Tax=Siminovitchia fortis TaxID=254758 RepID=UPI001FD1F8D2|nr:diaminobutyrate acetyltransferase [Siminovitchia fortis]